MGEDEAQRSLSWALQNADIIGVCLIAMMVVLVVWRAATRQPVSGAEAFIGIVGLVAIMLPVLSQISLEGFGVKVSASVQSIQKTSGDINAQIARLNQQQDRNTKQIEAVVGTLTELTQLLGGPVTASSSMEPAAGPEEDPSEDPAAHPSAAGKPPLRPEGRIPLAGASRDPGAMPQPAPPVVNAPPQSLAETLIEQLSDVAPAKDVTVLLYFREGQRQRAQKLLETLIARGYSASATLTDLVEAGDAARPGQIRVLYTGRGAAAVPALREVIVALGEGDALVVTENPSRLVNGDLQIQFF